MSFNNATTSNNIAAKHLKDRSAFKKINKSGGGHFRMIKSPKSEYNFYSHNTANKNMTLNNAQKELPSPMISVNNDFKDDQSNMYNILDKNREDYQKNNVFYQNNSSNNVPSDNNKKSSILSFKDNHEQTDNQNVSKANTHDPFLGFANMKRVQPNKKQDNYIPIPSIYEPNYLFNKGNESSNQQLNYNINNLGNLQQNIKFEKSKHDMRTKSSRRKHVKSDFTQIINKKDMRPSNKSKMDEYLIPNANKGEKIVDNNTLLENETQILPGYNYTSKLLNFEAKFGKTPTMNNIPDVLPVLEIENVIYKLMISWTWAYWLTLLKVF